MKLLIALLAIGAAVAGALYWRRNPQAVSSAWTEASDTTSSMAKTAADKVGEATDQAAGVASAAADEVKGAVTR